MNLEMHNLEAIVVRRWSWKAESPWSTLHCTSRNIQGAFIKQRRASSRSVGIVWEYIILPSIEDPRNCMDPQNLGQSKWDQMLGKIECVFSLYNRMRWKWDDVYLLRGLPNIYHHSVHLRSPCISVQPPSLLKNVFRGCDGACSEMRLETEIKWTQRGTWRPGWSKFEDALRERDQVNSDL